MSRGDKYSRASALSEIFKEMLSRHQGDKDKAKESMNAEVGPEWQVEIQIEDEIGPEFIDPDIVKDAPEASDEDVQCMLEKARKFSEDFVRPSDDLRSEPSFDAASKETSSESDKKDGDASYLGDVSLSELLREMADRMEKEFK